MSGTVRINYFRGLKSSEMLAAFRGVLNEKGINFLVNFRKFLESGTFILLKNHTISPNFIEEETDEKLGQVIQVGQLGPESWSSHSEVCAMTFRSS